MFCSVFTRYVFLASIIFMCAGCAGAARISFFDGVCGDEFDRCMERCRSRADTSPCEMHCRFRGKLCSRSRTLAQTSGRSVPQQGLKEHVELVDLSTFNPLISDGIQLVLSSDTQRHEFKRRGEDVAYYRVLPPGGSIDIDLRVPDFVDNAELVVRHGPAGKNPPCLVTISFGKEVLAGRYSPPRRSDGSVTLDRWDISIPVSRAKGENGQKSVKLFLLNNSIAGSKDDYHTHTHTHTHTLSDSGNQIR